MTNFANSLARTALALSILSTSLTPISSLAAQGRSAQCAEAFGGEPAYKALNTTANMSAEDYPMQNRRTKREYEITLLPDGLRFRDLLPLRLFSRTRPVVVDVGGGRGFAMNELAKDLAVDTIVINTQDFSALHRGERFKGSLEYRAGWAEQELAKISTGSVDMVVDLWGAFAYSPNKAQLIEEIYRILKPGGRAFLLHPSKTPAEVVDRRVNYGQPVTIGGYLKHTRPDLFDTRRPNHPGLLGAQVIEIQKPSNGSQTIDLGLEIESVTRTQRANGSMSAFSSVNLKLRD